jgi:sigma-B regulation protein RsbU (phosphoserine phosphatase)
VFPGVTYDQLSVEIVNGDVFVFCTDGIYETFNAAGEEFGTERVAETVQARRGESAQLITAAIFDAVDGFRGEAPQGDDMTVVVVKITA